MSKIPEQKVGKALDYSRQLTLPDDSSAYNRYREIVAKMLDVNGWQKIAEGISGEFVIVNENNEIQDRRVKKYDFIRIDIPGPGAPSGGGYDWVQVTALDQTDHQHKRKTFISLQPCPDPRTMDEHSAHFFKKYTSSNIVIKQEDNRVTLQYAGRNEVINSETEHLMDNIRNFLVGIGAKMGASYPQWKALIDGLAK